MAMKQPLYVRLDLNHFPGEIKMSGHNVTQQAKSVGYRDLYRDIQAMRDAEYQKELRRGEITPEFSGITDAVQSLCKRPVVCLLGIGALILFLKRR